MTTTYACTNNKSDFSKVKQISTEGEKTFVSYHQSTSDLLIYGNVFEFNATERLVWPQSSHFTLKSWQENLHQFICLDLFVIA